MSNNDSSKPKWYSIKEAAEFLDIGEPTLYRWMRDGKVTYRKVGDSTRFWKEDLEAVMEVHHSSKEIHQVRRICAICHGDDLIQGVVRSTGLSYFQPKKTKFWTLKDSSIETQAQMCARCGAITWFGNTEKLSAIREQAATQESNDGSSST